VLECGNELVEVAVERVGELVHGEADAMVGDPVFLEVVRADLLGSVAAADLPSPLLRNRVLHLAHFDLVEPRAQHLHGLCRGS
jgi:hypothetical protein